MDAKINLPMEKKYTEYLEEISSDELYEGLLGHGMFANKLPPIFTSVPFYDYCQLSNPKFSDKWGHLQTSVA